MPQYFKRSLCFIFGFLLAIVLTGTHRVVPVFATEGTAVTHILTAQSSPEAASIQATSTQVTSTQDAQMLLETGLSAYQSQQLDQAIAAWQAAAQSFEQQGNSLQHALALSYLSMAYQAQSQWTQAETAITRSLSLLSQQTPTSQQALTTQGQALNTQGNLQFSQGQWEASLQSWQQAGSAYQQAEDVARYTGSLINQARALQALGYFLQARRLLDEVAGELENVPPELQIVGLHNLGDTLQAIGDLDAAKATYAQAFNLAEQQSLTQEQTALLLSIGRLNQAQQQLTEALERYRQASAISPDSSQQAQANVEELSVLIQMEDWSAVAELANAIERQLADIPTSRAVRYAQASFAHRLVQSQQPQFMQQAARVLGQTVQQANAADDRTARAYALGYLGNAYEVSQQWKSAQDLTQDALLIAQNLNATDIVYQWQWQLGRILKAQNQADAALSAYQAAFQSLQTLRYDLAAIAPDQQFSFRKSVEPVYRDYVDLLITPGATPERLQQAQQVIESLQIAELNNFFKSACIEGQAVALDEVDQTSAAVIYPIILSDHLEVIVSLPDRPLQHHTVSVPRSQVNETLDELRKSLMRPLVSPVSKSLGESVYSWLVRPVESELQQQEISTLVFVLDGALRSVPMAALFDGDRYLIENYSVALTPGLQLIAPQPLQQQGVDTIAGGLTEARHGFSALANVGLELEKIKATVPSQVLVNQAFTSETLREQVESRPAPIVHLATHGQFSSRTEDTFILTWDRPVNVNELSAILRTGNQQRQTPIELLILSACETAAGDERAELGLAGVAVRAGARSTIASLWNLDDESGAVLVGSLYDALTESGISKAEALRQAQLTLLNNPDYRAPFFWSAFVLVGNWL